MKKILSLFAALCFPIMLFAQHMETDDVFVENFDGETMRVTTSTTPNMGGVLGDWQLDPTLSVSSPNSYHSPVYSAFGFSTMTTEEIELSSANVPSINYVYLAFDQICKVSVLDNAQIVYSLGYVDNNGSLKWNSPAALNFNANSDFYYGESTTCSGGKFNDASYTNWLSNNPNATPNNTWWHHEYFDLSSFVLNKTITTSDGVTHPVTHFRIGFRVSKTSSGVGAGWYIDNLRCTFSNCELISPKIELNSPFYVNKNNSMLNNIGPYLIHATITDNDTVDVNSILFTYQINSEDLVTIPNTVTSNTRTTNGVNQVLAQWEMPTICYYDTIRYHISANDVHGSAAKTMDTILIAWHNQTNIRQNDCQIDSLNTFPHCFIVGVNEPVTLYFKNKSDAEHSPVSSYQTSLNATIKVENANHQVTYNETKNWTGSLCFDERSSLSMGAFVPSRGLNYITVYINTRNGQVDGYHNNDTIRYVGYACDSLLNGDYTVGGVNPDFATMSEVKDALTYCGINGPATFHFRPGTYQDFDFRTNYIGQSDVNTITFQGDDVNTAVVINNHPDTNNNIYGAVTLMNVQNFIFKNLTIQGNNNPVSRGVVVRDNGSRKIVFDGCKITANPTNTTDNTSFAIGRATAAAASSGQTAVSDEIIIRNCNIIGGNYGIYYTGSNARRNELTIADNRIVSCYKGIYVNYGNPLISNNHLMQTYTTSPKNYVAIHTEQTIGADINGNRIDSTYDVEYGILFKNATQEDFFIRNNHVLVGNSNYGINIESSSSTATDTGYIYNNEVILYPVVADNSFAAQIKSSNGLKVINNSFYVKSDVPYSTTAALRIENNNNTYIYNNIFANYCNSQDNTNFPIYLNGNSTVTGTYNDFVSASGVVAYKVVARNTIAELEAAIQTISNNISLMPEMANPTAALLPTNFSGLECGRNSHVMNDIRGLQRSTLTYMGAYADQIAEIDAAVVSLLNPNSGMCPQPTYDITVLLANKGAQALNFANHHATLTVHSDTLNLHQTTNVTTGSIPVLGTTSKVIVNNYPIPVNQPIDFTFIVVTAGDNNTVNDTLRTMFVLEAATPDYEEDFSNGTKQTWTIEQLTGAGNWTFQEGTGTNPVIAPVYGTGRLFFNSKNFAANTESRAVMPVVNLTNAINPILEVWFAHDNTANKTAEGVTVKISTNGGSTYTALIPQEQQEQQSQPSLLKRFSSSATTPEWTLYTYDLSQYVSAGCVHIAFDAKSQAGNNINIDRIRLRNLLDNDLAVSNIYSNGEIPAQYGIENVVKALVKNEGRQQQDNAQIYLSVVGAAEQYYDTLTIPSLDPGAQTIITFPDHLYNVTEVKNVEVRSRNDENNINNACQWRMVTTDNVVNYADTMPVGALIGDYYNVIRPCVRYKATNELVVSAVKYYYDKNFIANPEDKFRAFVSNTNGEIIATSDLIDFNSLQQGAWNILPINNFALTNMDEFYVGIEMLAHGDYLCAQIETPLRDSTFYYLQNGTYIPQTTGRFMIGAVVDNPHQHDFAILNMLNPTTRCDLGHEKFIISITNNGYNDILPGSVLNYSVNGMPAVSQTLSDTLFSHQTTTFTFDADFDFTNNMVDIDSNYQIKVWVMKDAEDRLQYNDTLNMVISSLGKSQLPLLAADTTIVHYYTSGTLSATLPASIPQGVLGWFAKSGYEQWNLLSYGNTYTTPVTFFDTVYYVNANPGSISEQTVGNGTTNGSQPFIFNSGYSRGKILYTEDEIGAHGILTTIGVNVATAANGADGIPIRIYMKKTSETGLPTTSAAVDWTSEISTATLVVDKRIFFDHTGWFYIDLDAPFEYDGGNLMIYTETNCKDYCTGTGSACNTCGAAVSGGATLPAFKQTQVSGFVQYKNGNTLESLNSNYTAFNKRLNMYFKLADLACGSEKVPVYVHVPDIPTYDLKTLSLDYPETGCALYDEHIQVRVKNLLNIPVPANKVVVHAVFNDGTHLTQLVEEPFASEEEKVVTFATTYDFSAPTTTREISYTVYTTMPDEEIVYAGNDTIKGSITSTRTAWMEPSYTYEGEYTQTLEILQPDDRLPMTGSSAVVTKYLFYNSENATTPITLSPATASFYTTPVLYDTVTYWVEAITKTTNCTTRRAPIYVNVRKPIYDLSTDLMVAPADYQCATTLNPIVRVQVTNTDTTASSVIPAGTFNLTAHFTGAANLSQTEVIGEPVSSLNSIETGVTVNNLYSTTQNRTYQYEIYTNPVSQNMYVYRNNDTIYGIFHAPASPVAPSPIDTNVAYGNTCTITPSNPNLNYYYFYEDETSEDVIAEGLSFTTNEIFAPATYYYSGRITSPGFDSTIQVGTASSSQIAPFDMKKGHSYAKLLYSAEEIGGVGGTIDTLYVNVTTANTSGVGVPVKIWLKNSPDMTGLSVTPAFIWNNEVATAQKVFDGDLAFEHTGWYAIPVQGGFDYSGEALLMYVEHDCDGANCVNSLGIVEPKFQNSTYSTTNMKKVLQKCQDAEISSTTTTSFSLINYRWNTRFKFNYTCESPRSAIHINTTVPQHDVGVVSVVAPLPECTTESPYTDAEAVTVTIKNFGAQTASNFPVTYVLANQTPVTQNYSGSIASGETANMTFTQTVDLSDVYFETPFKAYTDMSSDDHHSNDTLEISVGKENPQASHPQYSMADGLDISRVTFAGIDNGAGSPYTNYEPDGDGLYSDYTMSVAPGEVIVGQVYPMSVTHSFTTATGTDAYKWVYIDYNRDGEFSSTELVYSSPVKIPFEEDGSNARTEFDVVIPQNASVGLTRMRVICAASNITTQFRPEGIYSAKGETEDYAVLISRSFDKDMGVSGYAQIANKIDTLCPDENAKIRVYVKNFGTLTQNFSATSPLTLTLTVSGPVNGTYTTTLNEGSLSSQQATMLTLENVNISAPGTYVFSSRISYEGDMYGYNDSLGVQAVIKSIPASTLPYSEGFDQNNPDNNELWLPAEWSRDQTSNNYKWKVYKAATNMTGTYATVSPNSDNNYPDHGNGHYLSILNNSSTVATWKSTVTSGCINLHYLNGYPAEVNVHDFFMANSTADFDLIVEVGQGDYYIPMDTLHKADGGQTDKTDDWVVHTSTLNGFDEVGHLRFRAEKLKGKLNVAIDDIGIKQSMPDLKVVSILYPYGDEDVTQPCMSVGDTIYPKVLIRNNGNSIIPGFDLLCVMQVGKDHDTISEHIDRVLQPNETLEYTLEQGFVLYDRGLVEFNVYGILDFDKNPNNNMKRVISCTNSGVDNYEISQGMNLYQNVPNPVDVATTRISYYVPESGKATLNIYSAMGQLLYTNTCEANEGDNFLDVNVANLSAGVYYYTLYFNNASLTKKMVIQK